MYRLLSLILFAFACLTAIAANAQDQRSGIYIIYDSSNSMWGELPDKSRKYQAARDAMRKLAGRELANRDIALRMYGHRRKNDCSDSELVIPWSDPAAAGSALVAAMEAVKPTGRTPIDRSLRAALQDFGGREGEIILISDGIESCDADPCALVREWRDKNIKINVHVVGLGLRGKERAAMQCIADASGTRYRDAFSADELIAGLDSAIAAGGGEKPDPGAPDPEPQTTEPLLTLTVTTPDGVRQKGRAIFMPYSGTESAEAETFATNRVPPGEYRMRGGVLTLDGNVYNPVEQKITVSDSGMSEALIGNAPRPPEVSAVFSMEGDAIRETVVHVYRDGTEIGTFHGDGSAFLPEGRFEFRTTPAGSSQELSVFETFVAGDSKQIRFDAATEVELVVQLTLSATGEKLLAKPAIELMQNGDPVKQLNRVSGGLVFPGKYRMVADDSVNHYEADIEVSAQKEQRIELNLPSAAVTVEYLDANGQPEKPKRVFVYPESGRGGVTRRSNEPFGLLPGTYILEGHPKKAGYPRTSIEVGAGETKTVTLRATGRN